MGAMKEFFAQMEAMGREAMKDVRSTVNEIYFDQPEHASEPGAPLNMTQREVYEQKHDVEPPKEADLDMDL